MEPRQQKSYNHKAAYKEMQQAEADNNKRQQVLKAAGGGISQLKQMNTGGTDFDASQNNNEFNLDRQEYQQVFKVFDKDNSGEITIQQVYELINKFEEGSAQGFSNLNLNGNQASGANASGSGAGGKAGYSRGNTHGIGSKNNAQNNYSNGYMGSSKRNGVPEGSYGHHSRHSEANGNLKISPNRRNTLGSNNLNIPKTGSNAEQQNIIQLKQTQLANNDHNRSPRRHSHLHHESMKGKQGGAIKLNGIGGSNNGSNNSDGKSNDDEKDNNKNDDSSPGLVPKNSKIKNSSGGNGSANNLLQQTNGNNASSGAGGNSQQLTNSSTPTVMEFPNGKDTLKFDEFINVIRDSCQEQHMAENYLVLAFSMFDRQKKGYISTEDLKDVFEILGESITDEEVNTMIKIAGVKSNDKINFKEFVDFFYKID